MLGLPESPPCAHRLPFRMLQAVFHSAPRAAIDSDHVRNVLARAKQEALHCFSLAGHCTVCVWIDLPLTIPASTSLSLCQLPQHPVHAPANRVFFSSKFSLSSSDTNAPSENRSSVWRSFRCWCCRCDLCCLQYLPERISHAVKLVTALLR